MQTIDVGAETKLPEGPGEAGEKKSPAPGDEEIVVKKSLLTTLDSTIAQAEIRIEALHKELKSLKKGEDNTLSADMQAEIDALKSEIEGLKSQHSLQDKTLDELKSARSTITELTKTAIHKATVTTTPPGSGQTELDKAKEPSFLSQATSDKEREVLERVRQRRMAQNRDPETGKQLQR